jgi:decaprenylphospho-beta-D-erythro-pentofuranosid-2-ulose 2-reductase
VIDAMGNPQSVLVLGGTSEIGEAILDRLGTGGRLERVALAARSSQRRDEVAKRLENKGVRQVSAIDFDAVEVAGHELAVEQCFAEGDIDVVVVAVGVLPDNELAIADPAIAVHTAQVNYVGAMSASLWAAARLREQGHGVLVMLSSVAGERPRRANFIYGSTKAAIDDFSVGLGESLRGSGVAVLTVRPGFVRTRMTAGISPAPFATDAGSVADAVARNLRSGSRTIWVPGKLRAVMAVLRHLPQAIFRRLPG